MTVDRWPSKGREGFETRCITGRSSITTYKNQLKTHTISTLDTTVVAKNGNLDVGTHRSHGCDEL